MTPLTEFLLARIAEDEATARGAHPGPWNHWPEAGWIEVYQGGPCGVGPYGDVIAGSVRPVGDWDRPYRHGPEHTADHIARHDPARVLAECEAKRRIVAECAEGLKWDVACVESHCDNLESILRALALPYVEHPDYREEWRA